MRWHTILIENTVEIDDDVADDVRRSRGLHKDDIDIVIKSGKLVFDDGPMKNIDYVQQHLVLETLKKHKVKGTIKFCQVSSNGPPHFWGYYFDGVGNATRLDGSLTFTETVQL